DRPAVRWSACDRRERADRIDPPRHAEALRHRPGGAAHPEQPRGPRRRPGGDRPKVSRRTHGRPHPPRDEGALSDARRHARAHVSDVQRTRNPRANIVTFTEGFSTDIGKVFVVGTEGPAIKTPEVSAI